MELNKTDRKLIDQIIAVNSEAARIHEYQVAEIAEFNHLDLGFYKRKTSEASESGFEWLFDIESPSIDSANNTRTAIRLLALKDRKTLCALFHLKMNLLLRFIAIIFRMGPLKVIEFETMFSDGSFVVTTTSKAQADIYKPPQISHHHVKDDSFSKLFKLHQQFINQHLSESAERNVLALESFEAIVQAQQTMDKYKLLHQQANHFLDQSQLPKEIRRDPDILKAAKAYAKSQSKVVKKKQQNQLLNFEEQLAPYELKFQETCVIPIDDVNEPAFAVKTDINNAETDRQKLQDIFKGSYYPVITDLAENCDDLASTIESMAVLSRYPFESEMEFRNQDAAIKYDANSLIAQSQSIDLEVVIEQIVAEHCEFDEAVLEEVKFELEHVERIIGSAPRLSSISQLIQGGKLKNHTDLQKVLINWILKNHRETAIELSKENINSYISITSPKRHPSNTKRNCAIILLPVVDMSEIPAFIHWEGSDQIGSAATCRLIKHWHAKYQAQLVAVEANSLEFHLPKPIDGIKEAFDMAVLHNALAPAMLGVSGNSIWLYALSLMRAKSWCLWDTP